MAQGVIMPRQGQSVESCILTAWHKNPGDTVHKGDLLFSYETDKSAFDEEAEVEGTLLERFFQVGDDVPCLTVVCAIGQAGEDISALRPDGGAPAKEQPAAPALAARDAPIIGIIPAQDGELKASPRAKAVAARAGADIRLATPTGPNGRIIERDVRELIADGARVTSAAAAQNAPPASSGTGLGGRVTLGDLSAPASAETPAEQPAPALAPAAEYQEVGLTHIRKTIARAMQASLQNTAQLTNHASFDASAILALRKSLKEGGEAMGLANITLNDIILYAVSRTLLNHPDLNAHFTGDAMRRFSSVHLGVAVDTPRGLMVPTLFDADKKSLNRIAIEAKQLAKSCQAGNINPDLLQGATFTISNLGALGVESFTPIINPPQTGILGVNCILERVRTAGGQITAYPAMGLSLTYDHRAVDGAPAGRFLKELADNLERFTLLMAK